MSSDTVLKSSYEKLELFPEDISLILKSMLVLKEKYEITKIEVQELRKDNEGLRKEVERAQANETNEQTSALHISKDFNKLQISYAGIVEVKRENTSLLKMVKDYERQIADLKEKVQHERESGKSLLQKVCKEMGEKGSKELGTVQAENQHLKEQLISCQEQIKNTSIEFQAKLRSFEMNKKEEGRHANSEYQERINKLQSELQTTRSHCRDLQERLRIDTANYQKKIKELEKSSGNPFLRRDPFEKIHPAAPKKKMAGRPMPALDFVTPEANRPTGNQQDQVEEVTQNGPRKRKLFVQRQDADDE